jgi:predicted alpha/beta-hydrolase family hydrolase
MSVIKIETPHGLARVQLVVADDAHGGLLLGHGAGGGVGAGDLQAAAAAALDCGISVALVEQPYRVAGRRAPARASALDADWLAVVKHLAAAELAELPLVFGGRSMGARVACRTAQDGNAVGVLCLAFPLLPPPRRAAKRAPQSRLSELEAVSVPTLIIQGENDRFGLPPKARKREVIRVGGDHSLRGQEPRVRAAVADWLTALIPGGK